MDYDADALWDELEIWTFVRGFTTAGTAFVLAVFFFTSLCTVRARSDPARVAFVWWLKLVFIAQIIGLPLLTAADIADVRVQQWRGRPWTATGIDSHNTITLAYDVKVRAGSTGLLFTRVSEVCLAMTLVELGNGLMFALAKERRTSQRALRWSAMSIGMILVILAITQAVLHNGPVRSQWYAVLRWRERDSRTHARVIHAIESYADRVTAFRRISGSYNVISFCLSLGVLIYASIVMHYYSRVKPRTSAIIYLFAALLNLGRWIWFLIVSALWILPENGPVVIPTARAEYGGDVFLNIILYGVILIMLFSIGVHKRRGVWTTLQPWMGGVIPTLIVQPRPMYGQLHMQQPMAFQQGAYPPGGMPQQHYQQQYPQQQQYQMPHGWQGSPPQQQQQGEYFYPPGQDTGGIARQDSELLTGQVAAHELGKNDGMHHSQELDVRNGVGEQNNNRQNA